MPERLDEPLAILTVMAVLFPTLIAIDPEPRLPLELAEPEEISVSAWARWTFVREYVPSDATLFAVAVTMPLAELETVRCVSDWTLESWLSADCRSDSVLCTAPSAEICAWIGFSWSCNVVAGN